jgi:hypothetical protein
MTQRQRVLAVAVQGMAVTSGCRQLQVSRASTGLDRCSCTKQGCAEPTLAAAVTLMMFL